MKPNKFFKALTGQIVAVSLLISPAGCGVIVRGVDKGATELVNSSLFYQGRHGALTEQEKKWAQIAWRYFENNYQYSTGLVSSSDNQEIASLWHVGDFLAALAAAYELGLITNIEFDARLSNTISFLNRLPLSKAQLPNRLYNTKTGKMVNYANKEQDIGWSAVDIGRLLVWLKIISNRYPQYQEYIGKSVLRWSFCNLLDSCGQLYGGSYTDAIRVYPEARLGYEEYVSIGYQLWGFNTDQSSKLEPYEKVLIYGNEVYYDARDRHESNIVSSVVSLPYLLSGMEFNWKPKQADTSPKQCDLAKTLYQVQEQRYRTEKIFTARTDHNVSKDPYFVYDAIYVDGYPWNTTSDDGKYQPYLAMVSTRAVFGMWALWKTDYTDDLIKVIEALYDEKRGWYEGRYEKTGGYDTAITASTNAMVLESLLYKVNSTLYSDKKEQDHIDVVLQDKFRSAKQCFPPDRKKACNK